MTQTYAWPLTTAAVQPDQEAWEAKAELGLGRRTITHTRTGMAGHVGGHWWESPRHAIRDKRRNAVTPPSTPGTAGGTGAS